MRGKTSEDIQSLVEELRRRVQGEVRFDPYSRALYSTDASIYQVEPVGVVIPKDKDDVIAAVETAARHGVALLPRGGGTSLAGQAVNRAIVLDLSKYMNGVLEVNSEERWVRTQPGITPAELNRHLRSHGLQFAPDPVTADRANVGGAIGNNSCGSHSVLYGKTMDHVRELRVVLADGAETTFRGVARQELEAKMRGDSLEPHIYREVRRIVEENREEIDRRFPRIMRRVSGYNLDEFVRKDAFDLCKLVVGSEGTLCTVVEAKLNLVSVPPMKGLAVLHFGALLQSVEAAPLLLEHNPSAIELVDRTILDQARGSVGFARMADFIQGNPEALLLVEVYGESEQELKDRLDRIVHDMERRRLAYASLALVEPQAQAKVWAVRRAGVGLLMGVKGDTKPLSFVEDTAVSPEKLPQYVRRFDEIVRANGTTAAYYGHASVGCLHIRPLINLKSQRDIDKMVAIHREVSDLVLEFGGAMSGEHGDGIVHGVWNEKVFGPKVYQALRDVKRAFDPKGIMNPGRVVDCPPITENLRYSPSYKARQVETYLDFSGDGGFAGSVELCNGVGACRKVLDGTMCPSYMVTREEEHSTRGRANALRAVLSGLLPPEEFTSRRLYEVLDLCLECKGCKAECPSRVDMAKLKFEFLAHYYRRHGLPLRNRLFGNIADMNRVGCALAPLSNWVVGAYPTRWLMERVAGIDRHRPLPPFARPTFRAWFRSHSRATLQPSRGKVVLFDDTFMDYNYPQVGIAATALLEHTGFEVILPRKRCCGRPMISKGMLLQARENARYNVDQIYPFVQQGIPVVGCEPSCILTFRDEYPDLLRDEKSRAVAQGTYLLEEFLQKLGQKGELGLTFQHTAQRVLFHGHCHQKAIAGTAASLWALRLAPGYEVQEVDSGCCGMAGAFGYEKEHYDISLAIGQQRLFPAIAADPTAEVAIAGVSCRQQIEHATGRRAYHVAELLARAVK